MPNNEERLASLETGQAVQSVKIDHLMVGQETIRGDIAALNRKLDDLRETIIAARAVGKSAWAISGGFTRALYGLAVAAAGGVAALFGQTFVR